jgi:hypothetical protein
MLGKSNVVRESLKLQADPSQKTGTPGKIAGAPSLQLGVASFVVPPCMMAHCSAEGFDLSQMQAGKSGNNVGNWHFRDIHAARCNFRSSLGSRHLAHRRPGGFNAYTA